MPYNKTVWKTGDIITDQLLNKIEDAIASLTAKIEALEGADVEIGVHGVTQTVTLQGNIAFVGEESESGDNEIVTKSDIQGLATTDALTKGLDGKQPKGSYATTAQLEGYASTSQLEGVNNKATALETRVKTAEDKITPMQGDITTMKPKIENLIERVTKLETPSA